MKLISKALTIVPAGLLVAGFCLATSAEAAMMKKMDHKMEMKCKAMHGMMMHGKCEMMKKKK